MIEPVIVEPRTYRDFSPGDRFKTFRVRVETSDLYVKAHAILETETEALTKQARSWVEQAIERRNEFLKSREPLDEAPKDSFLASRMIAAGRLAGTGPMAAVAGAVAEHVGRGLLEHSPEVLVENGGDIFIRVEDPIVVGIFAGESRFSGRMGIRIEPGPLPIGVCTSAGTVGPSVSLGKADAATVISRNVPLADAVATALGNRVSSSDGLKAAVEWAAAIPGVAGVLAIIGEQIAAQGDLELVPIPENGGGESSPRPNIPHT